MMRTLRKTLRVFDEEQRRRFTSASLPDGSRCAIDPCWILVVHPAQVATVKAIKGFTAAKDYDGHIWHFLEGELGTLPDGIRVVENKLHEGAPSLYGFGHYEPKAVPQE